MKILTTDIQSYVESQDWPKGLAYRLIDDGMQIWLTFYRDNWLTLSNESHQQAVTVVTKIMSELRPKGIPISFQKMESVYGA